MRLSLSLCLANGSRIIGTLLTAALVLFSAFLGGCSSISLAYNNGAQLSWWWLDGYFDFNREQTPAVKQGLAQLFDWHRATQLPGYAALLATAQAQVADNTTPAQACRWQAQARDAVEPTLDRLLEKSAEVLPMLTEPQFRHLERQYAKKLAEMRDNFLQPDLAERHAEAVKRTLERTEMLYGRLDAAQKKVIDAGVKASPFNPELWLAERAQRQRDTVQTLRRLQQDKADRDQRLAALRALVARVERSPDPDYRAYQLKLADYNCAFAAQVHNSTTAAQRKQARETLKGWETDLRQLAGER